MCKERRWEVEQGAVKARARRCHVHVCLLAGRYRLVGQGDMNKKVCRSRRMKAVS